MRAAEQAQESAEREAEGKPEALHEPWLSSAHLHGAAQRNLLCQGTQEGWRTELSPGLGWLLFPRKVSAPEEHPLADGWGVGFSVSTPLRLFHQPWEHRGCVLQGALFTL